MQPFSSENSLHYEELQTTEKSDIGLESPPNNMDICEHEKSTSRRRTPLRPQGTIGKNANTKTSDPLLNGSAEISFDGLVSSRKDVDHQDWCDNQGDSIVSIPSKQKKTRSRMTSDEDTVVTDATHAMSHSSLSSQSNGGLRCLFQRVDSMRMAASTRMDAKKTALEESLMQQLADMQSLHKAEIDEMEVKLHQREAAIKTLERALCLRNDAVDEVRDDLEKTQVKLHEAERSLRRLEKTQVKLKEAERTIKRLERQISTTTKGSNPPTQAVEGFSSRRTPTRRRRSNSAAPRRNGASPEASLLRNSMPLGALFDQDERPTTRRGMMGERQASRRSFDPDPVIRARRARSRSGTRSCDGMPIR
jgi:myosin heavy subunit